MTNSKAFTFRESITTTQTNSQHSRASISINGSYESLSPISPYAPYGDDSMEPGVAKEHRRAKEKGVKRQVNERLEFGWREYTRCYNGFDRIHGILLPKYMAMNAAASTKTPNNDTSHPQSQSRTHTQTQPPDLYSQQVLKMELTAMNDAWREMLLSYEQLLLIERETWSEDSLCLDPLPYLKSFAGFLEWEYKLIRGWELPSRYRQQLTGVAGQRGGGQLVAGGQGHGGRYDQQEQGQARPHEQRGGQGPGERRDAMRGDEEADQRREEKQQPVKEGQEEAKRLDTGTAMTVDEDTSEIDDWRTTTCEGDPQTNQTVIDPRTGKPQALARTSIPGTLKASKVHFGAGKMEQGGGGGLLKATLVQTINSQAPRNGSVTLHGLSLTKEALSVNLGLAKRKG